MKRFLPQPPSRWEWLPHLCPFEWGQLHTQNHETHRSSWSMMPALGGGPLSVLHPGLPGLPNSVPILQLSLSVLSLFFLRTDLDSFLWFLLLSRLLLLHSSSPPSQEKGKGLEFELMANGQWLDHSRLVNTWRFRKSRVPEGDMEALSPFPYTLPHASLPSDSSWVIFFYNKLAT